MVNRKKMTSAKCRVTGINDKLITYYRSNAPKELAFYGEKMQESQIMEKVQLALAEPVEDDDNDFLESEERRTIISGKIVPNNTVRVVKFIKFESQKYHYKFRRNPN